MASIVWPAGVPQTPKLGFQCPVRDTQLRVDAHGSAQVRPSSTAYFEDLSGLIQMTDAQYITLRNFYIATAKGGALFFDYTHPITKATVDGRFTTTPRLVGNRPASSGVGVEIELKV